MKNAEPAVNAMEQTDTATDEGAAQKKKKKSKKVDEAPIPTAKPKKSKPVKSEKDPVEPKEQKALKDDKLTKFLVSMKKSVRKNIKKEAAEAGISMNEYIVLAVGEKLAQDSAKQ